MRSQVEASSFFNILFELLPTVIDKHGPVTPLSRLLKYAARQEIERVFCEEKGLSVQFGPFGELLFPFHRMGAVDSRNLFDLDELILFSFYSTNKGRYKKVLDAGANLGLHSIILSRCGYDVIAYEPDPIHYALLVENLKKNRIVGVEAVNKALSTVESDLQFIRVLGNSTSSHLAGAKANPYGDLEYLTVKTCIFKEVMNDVDLVKMDIEGHEKDVLLSTSAEEWFHTDAMVEVGCKENADAVFIHFKSMKINLFAQKNGWDRVESINDMPTSYRDGSLFITAKEQMPW